MHLPSRFIFGSIVLILVTSFILLVSISVLSSPISSDTTLQNFVINQGDGLNEISTRLQNNKLIRNKYIFLLQTYQLKLNNKLQAGLFRLSPSMSTRDVVNKLTSGGNFDFWLKIIPGTRVKEISSKFVFPVSQEGYLFPDSYLIPDYFTIDDVILTINKNFDEKISNLNISKNNLSQIVTLASLLEREAKTKADKQMVAGIINNRLKINMALQVDATVQYARDSKTHPAKYWLQLSKNDLAINSLFNTYKNPGLPPSPICNPSYDSLFAAVNPTSSDYLYYIHGTDGTMHYAKTLPEHNLNIAKYLK